MQKKWRLTLIYSCFLFLPSLIWAQAKPAAAPKKTTTTASSNSNIKLSIERGKKVYAEQCLVCHQADGLGVSHMNPPLSKTKWVLGDKKDLIKIVLKGLNTEIEIDGDTYRNVMPPHEAVMNDQQVADVLTYIRNNFGNKASRVTETDVKGVRANAK
ncbi:MAG: cytochrome c [Bacteroidetes bacterium]|nr:cytochrome c [Bacteroidota bacterium]